MWLKHKMYNIPGVYRINCDMTNHLFLSEVNFVFFNILTDLFFIINSSLYLRFIFCIPKQKSNSCFFFCMFVF